MEKIFESKIIRKKKQANFLHFSETFFTFVTFQLHILAKLFYSIAKYSLFPFLFFVLIVLHHKHGLKQCKYTHNDLDGRFMRFKQNFLNSSIFVCKLQERIASVTQVSIILMLSNIYLYATQNFY